MIGIFRMGMRGASVDGLMRGATGAFIWLALAAVATLLFYGVSALQEKPQAAPPAQTANWMYDRSCGLPEQQFNNVALDVQQMQQAYYATALNLKTYATQLGADASAAMQCQPTKMRPADRKLYVSALSQAAAAASIEVTDPYASGSHLDTAARQLAAVAARTGENNPVLHKSGFQT